MEYAEKYNQEEPSHLTKNEKSWTKKDLLLLVLHCEPISIDPPSPLWC